MLLVRHGETEWNKALKYQGHKDIPLSEDGRIQAGKIAERLSGYAIHAAYSSDLSRAMETAQTIASYHNIDVKLMPELRETNFGKWEGLTYAEINELYHDDMANWLTNPLDTTIPGGESLRDVAERCKKGIDKIINDNLGNNVLVVAHGGIIRIILAMFLGMELNNYWKIRQDNASLNIVEYFSPDRVIVNLVNDINHLNDQLIKYV